MNGVFVWTIFFFFLNKKIFFYCFALLKWLAFDQGYILVTHTPSLPPHRRDGFIEPAPYPRLSVFPSLSSPTPLLQPFYWRASPQQPPDAKTAAVKGNSALSWPTVRHTAETKGFWRREYVMYCQARWWPANCGGLSSLLSLVAAQTGQRLLEECCLAATGRL